MNKNYIIIGVLIAIIVLLCGGIAYTLLLDHTEYVRVNIVENGTSMEIPNDMVIKSNNTDSGIVVLENDNTIIILFNSINKSLAQLMAYAEIKNPIFGNELSGNVTLNNPTIAGCSLKGECNGVFIGNSETHDNIIVISENRDIVNHIIGSIKWVVVDSNNDNTDNGAADTQPSAYAYKSDGTPMYSQAEVDNYMLNKYGMVDYHVGSNGYIDMDEPGYDDAGNYVGEEE